jgi:hypothetical protein
MQIPGGNQPTGNVGNPQYTQPPAAPTRQLTQGDRTRASMVQNPRTPSQDYTNWANRQQSQPQQMTSSQDYADWANQQNAQKLASPNPKGYTTDPSSGAIYDPNREVYMSPGSGYTTKGGALYDPSGDVYMSNPAATSGGAAGGGGIGSQVGGAISSGIGAIGSAIQSALSNVPSWKIQPSAIPDPSSFRNKYDQNYNFKTPSA